MVELCSWKEHQAARAGQEGFAISGIRTCAAARQQLRSITGCHRDRAAQGAAGPGDVFLVLISHSCTHRERKGSWKEFCMVTPALSLETACPKA